MREEGLSRAFPALSFYLRIHESFLSGIEPSGGMGLRNLIDSVHEGGSPHRDFLFFCKAKCPMEGRGNEFMKSLLNVTLIPEKMLDVLDPLEIRDDHSA